MALEDIVNQIGQQASTPSVMPQLAPATTIPSVPVAGSTEDLEQRAHAGLIADIQNRAASIYQPPQAGQYSPNNPVAQDLQQSEERLQQHAANNRGGVKGLLTNFFQGLGNGMMHEAGLPTTYEQLKQERDYNFQLRQRADAWEQGQMELAKGQAVIGQIQDNRQFNAQYQPLELQAKQAEIQGLQQTQQFNQQMRPMLLQHEQQAVQAGNQQLFDYGVSGTGTGKGVWLVDNQFNPIRQVATTSEKGSALELQKFQLQMQQTMGAARQQAVDIVEGRIDPSQISPRSPNYGLITSYADEYSRQKNGQPFDFSKATGDYKYANNVGTKNTLNYLNALVGPDGKTGNLQELINQSDAIGRTPFPALNDVAAWARLETGSPKIAAYHAQVTETADMVAKILQGGGSGTSDAKMRQAQELFQNGFNASQIRAVAGTLQGLLQNRKSSLIGNNTYLQKWYGPGGNGGSQATPGTAASPSSSFNWNSFPTVQP
jgi:hypothetical protein